MVIEDRVGCASWLDKSLVEKGGFYPRKTMTAEERLRWYAEFFDFVEVNSSYYALPTEQTTARWQERTPPGFLFGVKAWGPMTGHAVSPLAAPPALRALLAGAPRNAKGAIDAKDFPQMALDRAFEFFRRALAPLQEKDKLAYVLFQLAPWAAKDQRTMDYLADLPRRVPGAAIAVEFRHNSWLPDRAPGVFDFLRRNKLAHVAVDGPWMPLIPEATDDTFVLRCHGQNTAGWKAQLAGKSPSVEEKYDYLYGENEIKRLIAGLRAPVTAARRFLVFNNNNRDYPIRNAMDAKAALGQKTPDLKVRAARWKPSKAAPPELFPD